MATAKKAAAKKAPTKKALVKKVPAKKVGSKVGRNGSTKTQSFSDADKLKPKPPKK